jgi:hypothetical protein
MPGAYTYCINRPKKLGGLQRCNAEIPSSERLCHDCQEEIKKQKTTEVEACATFPPKASGKDIQFKDSPVIRRSGSDSNIG